MSHEVAPDQGAVNRTVYPGGAQLERKHGLASGLPTRCGRAICWACSEGIDDTKTALEPGVIKVKKDAYFPRRGNFH